MHSAGKNHADADGDAIPRILGGLRLLLFPNYFLIISYSISYSYYLFIFPKDHLLPIHFLQIKMEKNVSSFLRKSE